MVCLAFKLADALSRAMIGRCLKLRRYIEKYSDPFVLCSRVLQRERIIVKKMKIIIFKILKVSFLNLQNFIIFQVKFLEQ